MQLILHAVLSRMGNIIPKTPPHPIPKHPPLKLGLGLGDCKLTLTVNFAIYNWYLSEGPNALVNISLSQY